MIRFIIKTTTLLIVWLFFLPVMQAQNGTSSPFSIFGMGEIETRDFGRTAGMGNIGIGYQSENYLNRRNPAALSAIDTLRFVLDVSAAVKFSQFRTKAEREQTTDFNFKNLAVGVRLGTRWTSSIGLGPHSNVGYHIKTFVEGPYGLEDVYFSGNGGINKFYWANAFELFRGFSIGVTSSYLFGNYAHNEDMSGFSINETFNVSKIFFDFGAQYSHWFEKHTNISVGAVYGYKSKISIQQKMMVIEKNKRKPDLEGYIPESYGVGFSVIRNKKPGEWILAADYRYQNWSADHTTYKNSGYSLAYTDSRIYNIGLQMTPNTHRPEKFVQMMRFQLGACYNQSYLKVNGYQVNDYSVSVGVGIPFYRSNFSYVNVAVVVGESGTGQRGGITERYALLSVNLSLIERWFAKRQWY
jgi:hypothetical protein